MGRWLDRLYDWFDKNVDVRVAEAKWEDEDDRLSASKTSHKKPIEIVFGAWRGSSRNLPGFKKVLTAMGLICIIIGLQVYFFPAENVPNPDRGLYIALIGALLCGFVCAVQIFKQENRREMPRFYVRVLSVLTSILCAGGILFILGGLSMLAPLY